MATFNDLVEETLASLRGYVRDQELSTYLESGIDADDLTLSVHSLDVMSRGRVEVDDELLYVETVDRSAGTVALPPYGRGVDGTTAASHAANAKVTVNPLFPRKRVKDALNQTIQSLGGDLFGVAAETFAFDGAQWTYPLPAVAESVLDVQYEVPWDNPEWFHARRWSFHAMADGVDFATGKSITLGDAITPGMSVTVTYTKRPTALSAGADVFTTVTGLPASCQDVVVLGATYRLLLTAEAFRLNTRAIEPNQLDLRTQPGMPSQLAKFAFQMFRERVAEERLKLLHTYPVRVHFSAR